MSDDLLYVILVDDKIVHSSSPVVKLLKQDPVGQSITTFIVRSEKRQAVENVKNMVQGEIRRKLKLGHQEMQAVFEVEREQIEDKIISKVVVKSATIIN